MQFLTTTLAIAAAFAMTASSAPAPQSLNPEIVARANAKLNQYSNADW